MIISFYTQVIDHVVETIICGILLLIIGFISSGMSDQCYYAYRIGHSYDKEAAYFSTLALAAYLISVLLFVCILAHMYESRAAPFFNQISSNVTDSVNAIDDFNALFSKTIDEQLAVYENTVHKSSSLAEYYNSK